MKRVLIGEFGTIVRLGLRELLDEEGCDVVAEETATEDLIQRVVSVLPDVVVLDGEGRKAGHLVDELTLRFPSLTVIVCSSTEPTMRVFPPFHRGESYQAALSPEQLIDAVTQS